jgi:hypothetical protein
VRYTISASPALTGTSIAHTGNKAREKGAFNTSNNLPMEERKSHEGKSNTKENPAAA